MHHVRTSNGGLTPDLPVEVSTHAIMVDQRGQRNPCKGLKAARNARRLGRMRWRGTSRKGSTRETKNKQGNK